MAAGAVANGSSRGGAADVGAGVGVGAGWAETLNAVAPYDWAGFLRRWSDGHQELDVGEGLARQGWRLAFTDTPTSTYRQNELESEVSDLTYSLGLTVAANGMVRSIAWGGPAYRAGIGPKTKIIAVGGAPFTSERLIEAVRHAVEAPVSLTFEQDDRSQTRTLEYRGTLRYPRLERIAQQPDRLATLLAPRRAGRRDRSGN